MRLAPDDATLSTYAELSLAAGAESDYLRFQRQRAEAAPARRAEILKGFGMRLLAYDPYPSAEWAAQHGVLYADRETLAREGDVVSHGVAVVACGTRGLLRRRRLVQHLQLPAQQSQPQVDVADVGMRRRVPKQQLDALRLAEVASDRQFVFLGVGFETTAPTVAATVEEAHRNLLLTKALDLSAKRGKPVKLPLDPDDLKAAA